MNSDFSFDLAQTSVFPTNELDLIDQPVTFHEPFNFNEINSVKMLFEFSEKIQKCQMRTKEITSFFYKVAENAEKNGILYNEYKSWLANLLANSSFAFVFDPPVIESISNLFLVLFKTAADVCEASFFISNLMEIEENCFKMGVHLFESYIVVNFILEPFSSVIKKIINSLVYPNLRNQCLSIISAYLTNSNLVYKSLLTKSFSAVEKTEQIEFNNKFLVLTDPPQNIKLGLEVCGKMVNAPLRKFPSEDCYKNFLLDLINSICFFSHEQIVPDSVLTLVSDISNKMKKINFIVFMEPNDVLFNWLSSMLFLAQRVINQKEYSKNTVLVENLIKFWILPPNFLRLQKVPQFVSMKEDFLILCNSLMIDQTASQMDVISQIIEDPDSSFIDLLGQYYSDLTNIRNLFDLMKRCPENIGNAALICLFAAILESRQKKADIRKFIRQDLHLFRKAVRFFSKKKLEPPTNQREFILSDALSHLLLAFVNTYLKSNRIRIIPPNPVFNNEIHIISNYFNKTNKLNKKNDIKKRNDKNNMKNNKKIEKLFNDFTYLYIKNIVNLQVVDNDLQRRNHSLSALEEIPHGLFLEVSCRPEFVQTVSSLRFLMIENRLYSAQVKRLFGHLFSSNVDILSDALLRWASSGNANSLVVFRAAFSHSRNVDLLMKSAFPELQRTIEAQYNLDEAVKTLVTMTDSFDSYFLSSSFYDASISIMCKEALDYAHILIMLAQKLVDHIVVAEPNKEIVISKNILRFLSNLMTKQKSVNFGFLEFYGDFVFHKFVEYFFNVFHSKNITFFFQDKKMVLAILDFYESVIESGIKLDVVYNNFERIPISILECQILDYYTLKRLISIITFILNEAIVPMPNLLPSLLKYYLIETNEYSILQKLILFVSIRNFNIFLGILGGAENAFSDEANELLHYIFSEINSLQENNGDVNGSNACLTDTFEDDFAECLTMIKPYLSNVLIPIENG